MSPLSHTHVLPSFSFLSAVLLGNFTLSDQSSKQKSTNSFLITFCTYAIKCCYRVSLCKGAAEEVLFELAYLARNILIFARAPCKNSVFKFLFTINSQFNLTKLASCK